MNTPPSAGEHAGTMYLHISFAPLHTEILFPGNSPKEIIKDTHKKICSLKFNTEVFITARNKK